MKVERVSDSDSELLQYLAEHGVQFGTMAKVEPAAPYADTVTVLAADEVVPLTISCSTAEAVRVSVTSSQ